MERLKCFIAGDSDIFTLDEVGSPLSAPLKMSSLTATIRLANYCPSYPCLNVDKHSQMKSLFRKRQRNSHFQLYLTS